jgi:uncharacterized protein (DUF2236 family)
MPRSVQSDNLERLLEPLRVAVPDADAGLFGPQSLIWRVDREAALFLGAGRALLLQLAHPWVAAGIAEHSRTLADPIGRFHRTFDIMFTLVFGDLDQAFAAARRLHFRHAAVGGRLREAAGPFPKGAAYWANEESALQWVHATLVDTALMVHDLVLRPLTPEERERYYAETLTLGSVFGLPPDSQPPNWEAFEAYNHAMWHSPVLTVTPVAREIATHVMSGAGTWASSPGWYRDLTSHVLPEPLRAGFGLAYGERERRNAERAIGLIRRIYPFVPRRLRYVGPYQEAMARLSGSRPDPLTRALNRFWIGRTRMKRSD